MKLTGKQSAPLEKSGAHRTALVTGGTGGIGFHIAAGLARTGMHVLVTGRNSATGHKAVEQLKQQAGHTAVELLLADASLVRENVRLTEQVSRRLGHLDVLVNNVGGGASAERRETAEGLEAALALNFVGPFALTTHLLPQLARASTARIVNLVSSAFEMWKARPVRGPQAALRRD
jgi:NAD(P)-dependent dehydrogenase (short-subunit alcohol dehydrogenase family)